jgi:hypothetical protein
MLILTVMVRARIGISGHLAVGGVHAHRGHRVVTPVLQVGLLAGEGGRCR